MPRSTRTRGVLFLFASIATSLSPPTGRQEASLHHGYTGSVTSRDLTVLKRSSGGLEPSTPSLPSSDEVGSEGKTGKPRARKPRKKSESLEDE
jgi:hypothetical protein